MGHVCRVMVVLAVVVMVATPSPAWACSEAGTDMEQATTNGLPVVEQRVLASSLPLLPLSGRTARMTVRTWGDLRGVEVEQRLGFQMLSWIGCRAPMEGWVGDRVAYQVDDTSGSVQLAQIVDAADGLDAQQAAALTAALGDPVVVSPTWWDYVRATAWAWWPHVLVLAYLAVMFELLRRFGRMVSRRRERRQAALQE